MRYYKSFILSGLFAFALVSCNTDDLEKDIDALRDRVENVETQVQRLNDQMNIIRVLLDGNKTIMEWAQDGDTYTLKLSNGETLTLTPGVCGGTYPSVEVGSNGNWVIGGEDSGWPAKAQDGKDAEITPKFRIVEKDGHKYWQVKYGEGEWQDLENGLASGTNSSTSPITEAKPDGDNFKIVCNGQAYYIPIVADLKCEIITPASDMLENVWTIAGASELKLKAQGELVRVNAPADWTVAVAGRADGQQEMVVTVTPPATPSECVLTVEVTKGANTVSDCIRVKKAVDNYWAEYQAGMDLKIGDVVINKFTHPDAVYVQDENTPIVTDKVYFLKEGLSLTLAAKTRVQNFLYIVGENPQNPSTLVLGNGKYFTLNSDNSTAEGLYCKNIVIDGRQNGNYLSNIEGEADKNVLYHNYVMDNVTFLMAKDKTILNPNHVNSRIERMMLTSCRFKFAEGTSNAKIINVGSKSTKKWAESSVIMKNNVFYSSDENRTVGIVLLVCTKTGAHLDVERNTFAGVYPLGTQGYIQTAPDYSSFFRKNIVCVNVLPDAGNYSSGANIVSSSSKPAVDPSAGANFIDNVVYDNTDMNWKVFRTNAPGGFENIIKVKTGSPFVTTDFDKGVFVLNDTYKGKYGAE